METPVTLQPSPRQVREDDVGTGKPRRLFASPDSMAGDSSPMAQRGDRVDGRIPGSLSGDASSSGGARIMRPGPDAGGGHDYEQQRVPSSTGTFAEDATPQLTTLERGEPTVFYATPGMDGIDTGETVEDARSMVGDVGGHRSWQVGVIVLIQENKDR